MDKVSSLLTFRGRLNRMQYWQTTVLASLATLLISFIFAGLAWNGAAAVLFLPFGLLSFWVVLAASARRLHDRDKSAWWLVLFVATPILLSGLGGPIDFSGRAEIRTWASVLSLSISVWAFVELVCLRGVAGQNRFGPDSLLRSAEMHMPS